MMRRPLLARLALTAFNARDLIPSLSYGELMEAYLEHAIVEVNGSEGAYPERRTVLNAVVTEMNRVGRGWLWRDELYGIDALSDALRNVHGRFAVHTAHPAGGAQ